MKQYADKFWSAHFVPDRGESTINPNLIPLGDTLHWSVYLIAGFGSTVMLVYAASRQSQGDYAGAIFSVLGAIVCGLGPSLAIKFL